MHRNHLALSVIVASGFVAGVLHAQVTDSGQLVRWGGVSGGDTNSSDFGTSIGSVLPYTQVVGGWYHTVAIKSDGSVGAWGKNDVKQCSVPSGLSGVTDIAASRYFSAAVKGDGTVVGWGANWQGQCLGTDADGGAIIYPSTKIDATPVQIMGNTLTGVAHISAGDQQMLASKYDGTVAVWGAPVIDDDTVPAGLQGVKDVASGYWHSLALRSDATVVGWGSNYDWGGNWTGQANVPADLSDVTQIAAAMWHSVALKQDGTVVAWGGDYGPVGFRWWRVPDAISAKAAVTPVTQIAAGGYTTTVVFSDGVVDGWTQDESFDVEHGGVPVQFRDPQNPAACTVKQIAGGLEHTVSIATGPRGSTSPISAGGVACWGSDRFSQCQPPVSLMNVMQVAAGAQHTVVLQKINGSNRVKCLGDSSYEQGNVPALNGMPVQISAGFIHSATLLDDGRVVSWGGYMDPAPLLPTLATQVDCGLYHTAARLQDGTVVAWGSNWSGECLGTDENGFGISDSTTVPPGEFAVRSKLLGVVVSGVKQVAAGNDTVALKQDGTLVGWPNDLVSHWGMPADMSDVVQVDVGYQYVALKSTGTVATWGFGLEQPPADLSDVVQVSSGSYRSIALKADGTVVSWGDSFGDPVTDPVGQFKYVAGGSGYERLAIVDGQYLECSNEPRPGTATLLVSGSPWQDLGVWQWSNGAYQTPGPATNVNLGAYGSVGIDSSTDWGTCVSGSAGTLTTGTGTSLVACGQADGGSLAFPMLSVSTTANLAGRLLVLTGQSVLPSSLDAPVVVCGTVNGFFDLLQCDAPAPAGKFLTLVPSDVNGNTVFSLRLLDLPGNAELTGASTGSFSGEAVAAATIDINHDGFDDLALAIDFGAAQPGLIQILLNDGMGNLGGTSVLESIPAQPTCIAVGDVDGDGNRDVVVGLASDGTVRVYVDNGFSSLTAGDVINVNDGTPTAVMVLENSGSNFALGSSTVVTTSNSKLKIYGTTTLQQEFTVAGTPSTVSGGDTKGTGGSTIVTGGTTSNTFDLLPSAETGFVQTLVRGQDGQYAINQTFGLTAKPTALDVADIDGDGLADIVSANADPVAPAPGSAVPVLSIFRNNGGSFNGGTPYQPEGASSARSVALIDVDNDGDRDIVSVNNQAGTTKATLLRIDTLGAGTPLSVGQTTVLPANNPIIATRGNLDGVGGEDLFLVTQSGGGQLTGSNDVKPFLGVAGLQGDLDGDGSVGPSDISILLLDFGPCPGTPCPSDLDGDGEVTSGDIAFLLLLFG